MSSTCPYILAKTTQLCAAARISSQNENLRDTLNSNKFIQKLARIKSNLNFFQPDATTNLPPRLNMKGFSTAANYLCLQVRIRRLLRHERRAELCQRQNSTRHANDVDFCEECGPVSHCEQRVGFRTDRGNSLSEKRDVYFSKHGITEEELARCINEIKTVKKNQWLLEENEHKKKEDWSVLLQQKDLVVWRRPLNENGLFQYKAFGTFYDISSQAFFNSQIDLQYRKCWDKYAIALDIIDRSSKCGSEVVHWVTQFPYPLKSRDYVFVRRFKVDTASRTLVLVSRAAAHDDCPETSEYIRVKDYESQMVIRSHRSFDETGFDYILTYHDDSRVNVPSFCINMITGSAVPDFLKTLHDAAARIEKK